jgi:formylglycine-generating enzyme required for sulfatase activity
LHALNWDIVINSAGIWFYAVTISNKNRYPFMKKILLITSAVFLAMAFVSKTKKEFLPPGTIKINDTLYADQAEIDNFSYLEFVWWIGNKYGIKSTEHTAVLPDTLVWREKDSYNEPYVFYYLRHPAYRNYPVVGVSYEQAVEYCKWRTQRVKEFMCISKKYPTIEFEYRLPTEKEWEFLSNNGNCKDGSSVFCNGGKDDKGRITSNRSRDKSDTLSLMAALHDNSDVTAPVCSYWKNQFGLYNMIGNVAEMVREKGISKGGGWRNNLEECRVGKQILYTKPTSWLGFRCVCVIRKHMNS